MSVPPLGKIDFKWVRVEEYFDFSNRVRGDELLEMRDAGRIRDVEMFSDHEGTYVVFWTPSDLPAVDHSRRYEELYEEFLEDRKRRRDT